MIADLEILILQHLLQNKSYSTKVIPFLQKRYFTNRILFDSIVEFVGKYKKLPIQNEISVEVNSSGKMNPEIKKKTIELIEKIYEPLDQNHTEQWLLDTTEKWCQDRALELAIIDSFNVLEGSNKQTPKSGLPALLTKALSVSFNSSIGHDYFGDVKARHEYYTRKIEKIPFDVIILDDITQGGYELKTLNLILGGTHVGKSLVLCDITSKALLRGEDVLYVTLELSQEKIAQRIDANLLHVDIKDVPSIPFPSFESGFTKLRLSTKGNLVVKEYPNGTVHAGHFRALLSDLELKKSFKPRILVIDYLNICASERTKLIGGAYQYHKSIAEELRSLAVEKNICIWSASQLNRSGFSSSDPGLGDISESFGVAMTADFAMVITQDENLKQMSQYMCKQKKNRYDDMDRVPRFTLGVQKSQMKLYDVQQP